MSRFCEALDSGKFLVTAEIEPPKGVDLTGVLDRARALRGMVAAVNVTDQAASILRAAPWAVCLALKQRGLEPIMQVTLGHRNRIAIQADLLAASMLGIENILCMTGDPPASGDHPQAKAVFDLDVVSLIRAAKALEAGADLAGRRLEGSPRFCVGAVANPSAVPLDLELRRLEAKAKAGARFVQTQAVFDVEEFARFMEAARPMGVPVLAGILFLKSAAHARWMSRLPGMRVPGEVVAALERSADPVATCIDLASRTARDLRGLCRGMHLMATGWERHIPAALGRAGLGSETGRLRDQAPCSP